MHKANAKALIQLGLADSTKEMHRAYNSALSARLEQFGVKIGHWNYLRVLWKGDGLTQHQLAKRAGVKGPTAVVALRAMVRAGLIEKVQNASDRRSVNIFLTKRAWDLKSALSSCHIEVENWAQEGVTREEMEVYNRVNSKIHHNLLVVDTGISQQNRLR